MSEKKSVRSINFTHQMYSNQNSRSRKDHTVGKLKVHLDIPQH